MAEAEKTTLMNVSAEALWQVISDYENYPKFINGLVSSKVVERKDHEVIVEYHINLLKEIRYVLCHKEKPKTAVEWKMVSGDFFKSNSGAWKLKAKGKDKVEVTYKVEIGLPMLVPQSIVKTLVGSNLPSMLKSFEERAKKIMQSEKKKK